MSQQMLQLGSDRHLFPLPTQAALLKFGACVLVCVCCLLDHPRPTVPCVLQELCTVRYNHSHGGPC